MTFRIHNIQSHLEKFDRWLQLHPSATEMLGRLVNNDVRAENQCQGFLRPHQDILNLLKTSYTSLTYRHVFLFADEQLLLKAHNWFIPDYLEPEMIQLLKDTTQPFGSVIRKIAFTRHIIKTEFLPQNFDKNEVILKHRAILSTADKIPFCCVEENYLPITLKLFISKQINSSL